MSALGKKFLSIQDLLIRFRGWVQAGATLLSNLHLPNFLKGSLYQGAGKAVCVPGLNCYSCPAASGSCPIGALQAAVGSPQYRFSYYIVGFLLLLGMLLGRAICGFLCPFGWLQELLHKIPTKKFSSRKLKPLRYLKYGILVVMVCMLPVLAANDVGIGDPFFCKYLCPQGVLEGAIPLSLVNPSIRAALGKLFSWKLSILLTIIVLSVLFFRPFCKWLCPLGAFYALLNRMSLFRMQVGSGQMRFLRQMRQSLQDGCGCDETPNHTECIRCGMCARACPTCAVHFRYGFWTREERNRCGRRIGKVKKKKKKIKRIRRKEMKQTKIFVLLLTLLLVFSLAACGAKNGQEAGGMGGEPKNAEEAAARLSELMAEENEILGNNTELWEKVFKEADKGMAMIEDGKDYGEFLLDTIEAAKDQFTDEEYKLIKAEAQKIADLEKEMTMLEEKYPEIGEQPSGGSSQAPADGSAQKIPCV